MPRKTSIAPDPDHNVVTIESLNNALHPSSFQVDDSSRSTSPGGLKDPMEINFLTELDELLISHDFKKEMCNCPCKSVVTLKIPDGNVAMEAVKKIGWMTCHHENIEVFNTLTNELAILIEFMDGGCLSMPNRVQVYGPPGYSVGFVERNVTCCSESYEILNNTGDVIYMVKPSYKMFHLPRFPILTKDGDRIVAELVTQGCGWNFALNYIDRLTPSIRALIIGFALFLESIDSYKRNTSIGIANGVTTSIIATVAITTARSKSS